MTTPDHTPQPEQDVQELTDESLEEVSGGVGAYVDFLTHGGGRGGAGGVGSTGGNGGNAGLLR